MTKFPDPPIRTPFTGTYRPQNGSPIYETKGGSTITSQGQQTPSFPWTKYFQSVSQQLSTEPALAWPTGGASSTTGLPGQLRYDSNFLYVCVADNLWKRVSLASF